MGLKQKEWQVPTLLKEEEIQVIFEPLLKKQKNTGRGPFAAIVPKMDLFSGVAAISLRMHRLGRLGTSLFIEASWIIFLNTLLSTHALFGGSARVPTP
jgi:hypothetical protein